MCVYIIRPWFTTPAKRHYSGLLYGTALHIYTDDEFVEYEKQFIHMCLSIDLNKFSLKLLFFQTEDQNCECNVPLQQLLLHYT